MDENQNQNQEKTPEMPNVPDAALNQAAEQEKKEAPEMNVVHEAKEASETPQDAPHGSYEAHHIKILAGKDAVRARPGMYIGDTTIRGLHHLVYEAVDNSIDEALAGFCSTILVRIHKEGHISIEDNGRGIPVGIHPEYGENALTIVLSKLHAGGKFDNKIYKVSGGLHGVGISVANFLSSWFDVWVKRNGKLYYQRFEKGVPVTGVEERGVSDVTGTKVVFMPDQSIFPDITFHFDVLAKRLRELAFLNSGIKITLYDERLGKEVVFKYDGGLKEFVAYLNANKQLLHPVIYFTKKKDGVELEIGMQYTSAYQETEYTFANNINTQEGGTHLAGFKSALTRVINQYIKEHKMNETLEGDDVREGLTYIISVKLPHPQFEGQTKTKLGNGEVLGIVNSLVVEGLSTYLAEHPAEARLIIQKCLEAARAREAARKAKDLVRKGVFEGGSLPGKLADCSSRDPSKSEVFIVEGDSAGGSAKQGRNREFQAVLPLRGKILNVEKARLHKVFENVEICALITAIGTGVNEEFDLSEARYHKVIIATDADVDGSHIRTLLLTFFYRYMKKLIEAGYVYIAQPPLYKIQRGKAIQYAHNDREKEGILKAFGEGGVSIQRYKGLGEMNPEQLGDTTMDPAQRVLKQVCVEDAVEADRIFTLLMGEEVEPRRAFIMENAKDVVNLDV